MKDDKRQFNIDKVNIENSYSNQIEEFFTKIEDLIEKKLEANSDFITEEIEKLNFVSYDIDENFSEKSFIKNTLDKIIHSKIDLLNRFLSDNKFDMYYNEVPEDVNIFQDDSEDYVECENMYDETLSTCVSEINDISDKIKKILNKKNSIQEKKNEICIAITQDRMGEMKKLDEIEKKIKELQNEFDNLSSKLRENYMQKVTSV